MAKFHVNHTGLVSQMIAFFYVSNPRERHITVFYRMLQSILSKTISDHETGRIFFGKKFVEERNPLMPVNRVQIQRSVQFRGHDN